jgi:hypothetical protein
VEVTPVTKQTEVLELSKGEYEDFLAAEIGRWRGDLTLPAFISAYRAGELDETDPEVARLVALVGLGQNGR